MTESAASQNPPQTVRESFCEDDQNLTLHGRPRLRRAADLVYFVQATQFRLIKIGVAGDLPNRLRNLRTGCPDELVVLGVIRPAGSARSVEQGIHAQFWSHHHHGEWFHPSPALLDYIAQNAMCADEDEGRQHWAAACAVIGAISGEQLDRAYPGDDEPEPPPPTVEEEGGVLDLAPQRTAKRTFKRINRKAVLANYKAARKIA